MITMRYIFTELELPIFPFVDPFNKTALDITWELPVYQNLNFVDTFNYTATIYWPDDNIRVHDIFVNASSEIPMVVLNLEGYECQEINVEISMPGNCEPYTLTAALLLEPPYPLPQQPAIRALNATTALFTWQHPQNWFNEPSFSYNITAVVAKTSDIIKEYNVVIQSSDTPMEEFDLSDIEACEEINFTLSLANDCRENWTTFILPICKTIMTSQSHICV